MVDAENERRDNEAEAPERETREGRRYRIRWREKSVVKRRRREGGGKKRERGKKKTEMCVGVVLHVYKPAAYLALLFPKKVKSRHMLRRTLSEMCFFTLPPSNHG